MLAAIRATLETPDLAVPGSHCHFCKGDGVCQERATSALVEIVEELPTKADEHFSLPEPNRLDDTQIAAIYLNSDAVRQFLKAVESQAFSRRLAGQMANCGVKLVRLQARRAWKPETTSTDVAMELMEAGVPLNRLYEIVHPSPNQADELLTEFVEDPEVLRDLKTKFAVTLTKKESSGLKLAPSSARGKEVDPASENTEGLSAILPPPS